MASEWVEPSASKSSSSQEENIKLLSSLREHILGCVIFDALEAFHQPHGEKKKNS